MARQALGPYKTRSGELLTCGGCGKQDAFEARRVYLWSSGPVWWMPWRRTAQVGCWSCGHIHWFMR